jgi:hypothetical protein
MKIKEFDTWYKKVNKTDDDIQYLKFTWELMESPYTKYHFSLMANKNTVNEFKEILWDEFPVHTDAEEFLLNKLEKNENTKYHGEIIFCLGKIIDQWYGEQKDKVLEYTLKLANSTDENVREKAIIVLGWLGGSKHIGFIADKLLNDPYNKCRAWSASSFMQIWFRRKNQNFVNTVLPYLYKAIKQETDTFVIGIIISSFQKMIGKKFVAQKYIDLVDKENIGTGKIKLIKYYEKMNGIRAHFV